jgi:hypothetical protein
MSVTMCCRSCPSFAIEGNKTSIRATHSAQGTTNTVHITTHRAQQTQCTSQRTARNAQHTHTAHSATRTHTAHSALLLPKYCWSHCSTPSAQSSFIHIAKSSLEIPNPLSVCPNGLITTFLQSFLRSGFNSRCGKTIFALPHASVFLHFLLSSRSSLESYFTGESYFLGTDLVDLIFRDLPGDLKVLRPRES